jgi:hypothetical protein
VTSENTLALDRPEFKWASRLSIPDLTPEAERRAAERFARHYAAPEYRNSFNRLYPRWWEFNASHFGERLMVPHISIGLTNPRRFSECRLTTEFGGQINIVLADRIVFGTDQRVVRTEDLSAAGLLRFTDDLLLSGIAKQYVLEVLGTDEDGYGGYGPRFAAVATRIGEALGLPQVEPRRRGFRAMGQPVAAFWPWAFRPDGYYLGHVRLDHLRVAGLRSTPPLIRQAAVPGMYEYFLYLLVTNQITRLTEILGRQVDAETEARSPAVAAAERNPLDSSGMLLSMPVIAPGWLVWNAGCIPAIAEGIRTRRAFDGMPILADALQDAGCEDPVLLDHCRARTEHTANCWVLRLLTENLQT